MADNYSNALLTEICELLLEEDVPLQHVRNLAADLAGEYESMAQSRDEAAYEAQQERGPADDSSYRRAMIDAGRGHLLPG